MNDIPIVVTRLENVFSRIYKNSDLVANLLFKGDEHKTKTDVEDHANVLKLAALVLVLF